MKVEKETIEERKKFLILVLFNGTFFLLLEQGASCFHFALSSASFVADSVYHSEN